jgi:hypothetical protein
MERSLAKLEFRLAEIERRIMRASVLVERQRVCLSKLASDGHETGLAVTTLDAFNMTLGALEQTGDILGSHADALVQALSAIEPLWIGEWPEDGGLSASSPRRRLPPVWLPPQFRPERSN